MKNLADNKFVRSAKVQINDKKYTDMWLACLFLIEERITKKRSEISIFYFVQYSLHSIKLRPGIVPEATISAPISPVGISR